VIWRAGLAGIEERFFDCVCQAIRRRMRDKWEEKNRHTPLRMTPYPGGQMRTGKGRS